MTTTAPDVETVEALDASERCGVDGCERKAVEVLRFRDQSGHVHVCAPCGALDREHCDVIWSGPMPCPWPETHGTKWSETPRLL